jgi:hypothetical protein
MKTIKARDINDIDVKIINLGYIIGRRGIILQRPSSILATFITLTPIPMKLSALRSLMLQG